MKVRVVEVMRRGAAVYDELLCGLTSGVVPPVEKEPVFDTEPLPVPARVFVVEAGLGGR